MIGQTISHYKGLSKPGEGVRGMSVFSIHNRRDIGKTWKKPSTCTSMSVINRFS